jgi:hypothetical protein
VSDEHGTTAGYRTHKRRGEKPCRPCKVAWNRYIAEYRSKKGRRS